ncbi:MAG: hypothetical protein GW946_00490 [Candidatus Pacebacteria bacterium]|nr:hypothetical protein [Candidatus Paceibacterota bacterium]
MSSQESYPRIADEVTAQQLRKQPVAVPPVQENQRSTFLSKEQQKRYADRFRSISTSVAAEMDLTLNQFDFGGNLANALGRPTKNEVIDSLGTDVLEGFFTPNAEAEFTEEQHAFIGEVIKRLFDESHIADNEVAENAEMLSNRVFRLEQALEKATTDSDAPARMKIEPELAQARAEFRALQSRSDAKKDDEKAEKSSKKSFWQRFFPSKAPKTTEPMKKQQVADSGPVASEEEKERIIVSLRDEKESRESEAELQRVDTEYVVDLVGAAIDSGKAAEDQHVQAVAEFMLRLMIKTRNQLNLAPEQEAELKKLLERAKLHPNERHATERPFESELTSEAGQAIERSILTPGQKNWLRKALETAGIVVSGALASSALGAMGAGPESRMAVSSVVLLATAAVGDTTPGTFVRGTLVGLGENQNLPSWIRGIAQGASRVAHGIQDRTRTLFAFFGGMLGEATIELGARLLQEAAPAAPVAVPVAESAGNPLTKASETAVQNLLQQFAEARPLVESAPDQAASEVAKTIAGAARTFADHLVQDPGQIDVVLQQAQTYFTPERVRAIAEVAGKFDPAVGPQMLTAPETAQLATNSQEAVKSITALMDRVSGMTTAQRAQQLAPWVNQITSVLKGFQAIAPAR